MDNWMSWMFYGGLIIADGAVLVGMLLLGLGGI